MSQHSPSIPDPVERARLKADLNATRERLHELDQKYPQADAAVGAALSELERAKLSVDLRPDDRGTRDAVEKVSRRLDEAMLARDTITESIERLRKHAETLSFRSAAVEAADHTEAQAAFRAALAEEIKDEAPAMRRWAGLILFESELAGRQVVDVGTLLLEYFTGSFRHSGLTGDRAGVGMAWDEAARTRGAYERGEALP